MAAVAPQLPKPAEWGPHFWYMLDTVALGYGNHPDKNLRRSANVFLHSLKDLLPCPECRQHYRQLLRNRPPAQFLDNGTQLAGWIAWVKAEVGKKIELQMTPGASQQSLLKTVNFDEIVPVERRNVVRGAQTRSVAKAPVAKAPVAKAPVAKAKPVQRKIQSRPARARNIQVNRRITTTKSNVPTTSKSTQLSNAQKRLKASAKYYKRPCNCY